VLPLLFQRFCLDGCSRAERNFSSSYFCAMSESFESILNRPKFYINKDQAGSKKHYPEGLGVHRMNYAQRIKSEN
jgi:hypothetical protein